MTQHRYKIVPGQDGTYWVPLQPLIADLREERARATLAQNSEACARLDLVIQFIDSLISEGNYNLYKNEVLQ